MYTACIKPLLFRLDPELAHTCTVGMARLLSCLPGGPTMLAQLLGAGPDSPQLQQTLWGKTFTNPVGLAAGFDKHVAIPQVIRAMGFGFAEVGSLSALPWEGNPKQRLFRLPEDEAIINRMGLNNPGVGAVIPTLNALSQAPWPVGVSLVKTPDPTMLGAEGLADFVRGLSLAHGLGAYVSLNISCPNTEEGKTFEDPEALDTLLGALRLAEAHCTASREVSPRPWLLKLSPDLSEAQVGELFAVGLRHGVAGWIATNTTALRTGLRTEDSTLSGIGRGGLSGKPLQSASTRVLGWLYQAGLKHHTSPVLMGVGGVRDVDTAWEKIAHGASLLQIYTALIYEGPGLVRRINTGLAQRLESEGFTSIQDAVGLAFR